MKKIIIILTIAAGIVGLTFLVKPRELRAPTERPVTNDAQIQTSLDKVVSETYVKYSGRTGKTAFALLQETTNIEFKQYDFGVFVESINGVKPDSQHFWKLYVNGQESQVGVDQVQTRNGDIVEWRLEEIK